MDPILPFWDSYPSSSLHSALKGARQDGRASYFFASLFDCMWNVEWKWACLFLIFFFFFPCMGHDVIVKTHTRKKKKLKTGNSNFVRHFTCNQIDLKLSDFLFHHCHLMMAVPLKILFLLICFASKKMLFASRDVLNISQNLGFVVHINVKIIALGICITFWRVDKVL